MLLAAIIMLIVSALYVVIAGLVNISDITSLIGANGLGGYLNLFFAHMNTAKFFLLVFVVVGIIGIVLLIRVLIKKGKTGEADESVSKAGSYCRGLWSECKKIIWPTGKSVVRNTLATLAICAVIAVLVVAIDLGLGALVNLLISLK